jgi:hypothetical protein
MWATPNHAQNPPPRCPAAPAGEKLSKGIVAGRRPRTGSVSGLATYHQLETLSGSLTRSAFSLYPRSRRLHSGSSSTKRKRKNRSLFCRRSSLCSHLLSTALVKSLPPIAVPSAAAGTETITGRPPKAPMATPAVMEATPTATRVFCLLRSRAISLFSFSRLGAIWLAKYSCPSADDIPWLIAGQPFQEEYSANMLAEALN